MKTHDDDASMSELLRQDTYSPQELAELTGIGDDVILRAARTGDLPALIVDHDVMSIRRDDALIWMRAWRAAQES